jgi:NTE family protein
MLFRSEKLSTHSDGEPLKAERPDFEAGAGDSRNIDGRNGDLPALGDDRMPKRGGVALALGGGAAKGWAHIGVLRAFDEANVPISMIAGTSIGALVGGCYLAGKLDDLEEFARSLTLSGILRYMDFSLRGSGLISGTRLTTRMFHHLGDTTIESLDRQFVSICTDIRTGHEIWLHDGPLVQAISASYALPGVFAPIPHNGRLLVDGAIVNPVPVSACRAYEPEVVVAIDLNSEAFGRGTVIRASHYEIPEEKGVSDIKTESTWLSFFTSRGHAAYHGMAPATSMRTLANPKVQPKMRLGLMGVMMEAFNIIQDRIARARLAGDPPDYVIRPKLFGIGLADFHKAEEAIRIGYQETKARLAELSDQRELT